MAGDWIKIEHWTQDKPEVFLMADTLGIDADEVLGKLVRVWVWADQQTFDGNAQSVTFSLLDRVSGRKGFAEAMLAAGWLKKVDSGVQFVNFERHNGETAKTRAMTAKRVQRHRTSNADRVTSSVTKALPEKRREEKSRVETQTQEHAAKPVRSVFRKPSAQDVAEYVTSICADIDPQTFIDHYDANGWKIGGKAPMRDWKAAVRTWHKRREEQRDHEQSSNAVKAGWTAQARQDAQWAVFAEFDAAARRDNERRAAASSSGGGERYLSGDHASLFGEEPGTDDAV